MTTFAAQRTGLSRGDIAAVRVMYRKPAGSIVGLGDKCVTVRGGNSANRTPIEIFDCLGAASQKWWAVAGNVRGVGNKYMDMPYWTNGSGTWLFDCWGGSNQRFDLTGVEVRTLAGKCVSAPRDSWYAKLAECKARPAEIFSNNIAIRRWTYTPSGEIRTATGLCLDVRYWETRNGTRVVAHPCNGGANQKWSLGPNGQIRGLGGKCLDVPGFADAAGAGLHIWDCHGGSNQMFSLRGQIREPGGKCLDIPWSTANGTPATVWDCHEGANQKFEVFP